MYTTVMMIAMATTGGHKHGCYSCASAAPSCSTCTKAVASSCCKKEGLLSRLFHRNKCNGDSCSKSCSAKSCSTASACSSACNGHKHKCNGHKCNGRKHKCSSGCAVASACSASACSAPAKAEPAKKQDLKTAPKAGAAEPKKTTSTEGNAIDTVGYEMPEATYVSEPIIVFARN